MPDDKHNDAETKPDPQKMLELLARKANVPTPTPDNSQNDEPDFDG